MFHYQIDWIINNKTSSKIAYVITLGDMSDHGDDAPIEFTRGGTEMYRLESANIPYGTETTMRRLMVLQTPEVPINMQIGLADTIWRPNPGMEVRMEALTITTTIMTFLLPVTQILSFYTSNTMHLIMICIILLLQIMS